MSASPIGHFAWPEYPSSAWRSPMHAFFPAQVLAGVVSLNPSPTALPGHGTLEQLTNGIGWWALLASLVGLVLGAAAWALGSHTNNYQYASTGRRTVLVSGMAALLIGAAPTVINFLFNAGHGIR